MITFVTQTLTATWSTNGFSFWKNVNQRLFSDFFKQVWVRTSSLLFYHLSNTWQILKTFGLHGFKIWRHNSCQAIFEQNTLNILEKEERPWVITHFRPQTIQILSEISHLCTFRSPAYLVTFITPFNILKIWILQII